jgi:hypothetical protein
VELEIQVISALRFSGSGEELENLKVETSESILCLRVSLEVIFEAYSAFKLLHCAKMLQEHEAFSVTVFKFVVLSGCSR